MKNVIISDLNNRYIVAVIPMDIAHNVVSVSKLGDLLIDHTVTKITSLNHPCDYELILGDQGADPIPVTAAGVIIEDQEIKGDLYLFNSNTSVTPLNLLIQGIK